MFNDRLYIFFCDVKIGGFKIFAGEGNTRNIAKYSYGRVGVVQDYPQAMPWFRKGADGGDAFAIYNIGTLYDNGRGVDQDYQQAMAWYRKAADTGIAAAMNKIGDLYQAGPRCSTRLRASDDGGISVIAAGHDQPQAIRAQADQPRFDDPISPIARAAWACATPWLGKTVHTVFLQLQPHCPTQAGSHLLRSAGFTDMGDTGLEPVTLRV